MRYIITLNNVKNSDVESAGFRAVDLALLREKTLNIPLCFIINNQAFEDFLTENGLKAKIEKAFHNKHPLDAYKEVVKLFNEAVIPKELEAELFEAYQSLSIDPGASASSIVSEWDYPFVNLIRSPSYLLSTDDEEGIIQNIKGKDDLIAGLKQVWASLYSPKSSVYRENSVISDSFGLGVIVQKMKRFNQSAVSYSVSSFDERTIIVKGFLGLHDYGSDDILGKDCHEVDTDSLLIKKAQVNVQEYALVRELDQGGIIKHDIREEGARQKLDDKQISEVARITKRAKSFIGKDIKLYMGIRDAYNYICQVNRIVAEPKRVAQENDEVKIGVDEEGVHVIEHKHEIFGEKEEFSGSLNIPEIITDDKARQEAIEERQEVVVEAPEEAAPEEVSSEIIIPEEAVEETTDEVIFEEDKVKDDEEEAFDRALEKDLEFLNEIINQEVDAEEEIIDEDVDKEVNLLQEVLNIKHVIEKMEDHALNNNHIAYEQEARKLRKMVDRVRGENE